MAKCNTDKRNQQLPLNIVANTNSLLIENGPNLYLPSN